MNKAHFINRFIMNTPRSNEVASLNSIEIDRPLKKAAILMPIVESSSGLTMIMTQRALHLKHHPGQVSFPGGRFEQSDPSLAYTALRETEEEIGIKQSNIELLGQLPEITTTSGYHVSPFIGFVKQPQKLLLDSEEVKDSFEAPLPFLLNPNNYAKQQLIANRRRHYTYCCAYQNHLIWGATAQMLISLQKHIS